MSTNCLKTTLKATIDNNSLRKFGKVYVFYDTPANDMVVIQGTKPQTIKIVGDGYFTNSSYTSNDGKTATITTAFNKYIKVTGTAYLEVDDAEYGITSIYTGKGYIDADFILYRNFTSVDVKGLKSGSFLVQGCLKNLTTFGLENGLVDTMAFSGSTTLSSLNLTSNNKASGNILVFANNNLTSITIRNTSLEGDIVNLSKCISATTMTLRNTNLYGSIESLVEGLYSNGKASGTIAIEFGGTNITFHGNTFSTVGYYLVFSSSGVSVTNGGATTYATYDGSTWSYN